jgi:5-methylcytosine-specific restriction endonuclease McrA
MNNVEFHVEFEKAVELNQSSVIPVLHFINDCERRRSYLDLGYSSIFDFCTRKHEYSSSTAGRYIQAARCIKQNPELLPMLETRELSVSTICLIASILSDDNKASIIERVKGKSRPEVERVAREYRPPVELRDRMVPVRANTAEGVQNMVFIQFLATDDYANIFEEVRNSMPGSASFGEVSLAVFREYRDRRSPIERQKRREKKGSANLDSHQRESSEENGEACLHSHRWELSEHSRHIPDEVRDVIFSRDGGQCAFVAADGTRCRCRKGLQVDHINPFANHGSCNPSNLRLLCGGHNRLMAERTMGRHVMQPYWRQP